MSLGRQALKVHRWEDRPSGREGRRGHASHRKRVSRVSEGGRGGFGGEQAVGVKEETTWLGDESVSLRDSNTGCYEGIASSSNRPVPHTVCLMGNVSRQEPRPEWNGRIFLS